jgi:hypothetical protein
MSDYLKNQFVSSETIKKAPLIFVHYISFFSIFCGALNLVSLVSLRHKIGFKKVLILFLLFFTTGYFLFKIPIPSDWETNFGMLDQIFKFHNVSFIKILGWTLSGFFFVDFFLEKDFKTQQLKKFFFWTYTPYILAMLITRPAQRYLVFFLPSIYFFYITKMYQKSCRSLVIKMSVLTLLFFTCLDVAFVSYQMAQGKAAESMALWMKERGYLDKTRGGQVWGHAGHIFLPYTDWYRALDTNVSNHVVLPLVEAPKTYIYKQDVILFGKVLKTYYLIKE